MHTVMHTDCAPFVQACADELAGLTPDLLKSKTGPERHGVNRVLVFGERETNAAPPPDPGAA